MTLLALIPARGGSKGIPRKNIRDFCGKPLISWSIDAAKESNCVDQIVVSTDDHEIASIAEMSGAEVPFLRPSEISGDTTPGIATVLHAMEMLPKVSDVLLLQPTSPLRISSDIESIFKLRNRYQLESAVSITFSSKHPAWMYSLNQRDQLLPFLDRDKANCRQQLPPSYYLNGALYLASREFLLREKALISEDTVGYIMPPDRSVDIDTLLDWEWAEFLMRKHQA
jgi:N-acylneuraminate cytidylyltransferase